MTTGEVRGTGWQGCVPDGMVARLDTNELIESDYLDYLIQWHLPETRDLEGLITRIRNTRCVVDSRFNVAFTEALNRRRNETRVHPYDYMRKLSYAGLAARRKELYDRFWHPRGDLYNPAPHWFSAEIRDEHDEVVRQLGLRWAECFAL